MTTKPHSNVKSNNLRHGMCKTRLYRIWSHMKTRTTNPKANNYERYGAKGIRVCDEWQDFMVFHAWATTHGYSDTLTIDRIDPKGNYEPSNCRFLTKSENCSRAKKHTKYIFNGETIPDIAKRLGVPNTTIYTRLRQGRSFEHLEYKGSLLGIKLTDPLPTNK